MSNVTFFAQKENNFRNIIAVLFRFYILQQFLCCMLPILYIYFDEIFCIGY